MRRGGTEPAGKPPPPWPAASPAPVPFITTRTSATAAAAANSPPTVYAILRRRCSEAIAARSVARRCCLSASFCSLREANSTAHRSRTTRLLLLHTAVALLGSGMRRATVGGVSRPRGKAALRHERRTLIVAVGTTMALTAFGGTGLALAQSGGAERAPGGGPHHAMSAPEKGSSSAGHHRMPGPGMGLSRGEMRRLHQTMTKDPAMQGMHRMMMRNGDMRRCTTTWAGRGRAPCTPLIRRGSSTASGPCAATSMG